MQSKKTKEKWRSEMWADERMNDKNGNGKRQTTLIKKNVVSPVNKTGTSGLYLNLCVH